MAVTLQGFRDYWTLRGDEAPENADDDLAAAALVRSGDYVQFRYVVNLAPNFTAAALEPQIDQATYIAALSELATPGFFTKTFTMAQQKVLTEVKGIKWTPVGDASGTYAAMPTNTMIDAIFEPYIIDRDGPQFSFRSIGGGS